MLRVGTPMHSFLLKPPLKFSFLSQDEFESAKQCFGQGAELRARKGKDVASYQRWIRKCDAELTSWA